MICDDKRRVHAKPIRLDLCVPSFAYTLSRYLTKSKVLHLHILVRARSRRLHNYLTSLLDTHYHVAIKIMEFANIDYYQAICWDILTRYAAKAYFQLLDSDWLFKYWEADIRTIRPANLKLWKRDERATIIRPLSGLPGYFLVHTATAQTLDQPLKLVPDIQYDEEKEVIIPGRAGPSEKVNVQSHQGQL